MGTWGIQAKRSLCHLQHFKQSIQEGRNYVGKIGYGESAEVTMSNALLYHMLKIQSVLDSKLLGDN